MKLTARARYGLMAMLDLAMHSGNGPVMIKTIARRQDVSSRYLENIMTSLVAAGMARGLRGHKGGFSLARPASEIRLSQIIQTTDGKLKLANCLDGGRSCRRTPDCAIKGVLKGLSLAMVSYLDGITLQSLAVQQEKLDGRKAGNGHG